MSYKDLSSSQKKEINHILNQLNNFLRDNCLYLDAEDIPLYSTKYGYLASLEDTRISLSLLEDSNYYVELYTTEEK